VLSNKGTTFFNIVSFLLFAALVFFQYSEAEVYGVLLTDIFNR
jgi:hypothetical protein